MIVIQFIFEERGEELKVSYYASAAAVRDGNLPYIIATSLYSQQLTPIKPTLNSLTY